MDVTSSTRKTSSWFAISLVSNTFTAINIGMFYYTEHNLLLKLQELIFRDSFFFFKEKVNKNSCLELVNLFIEFKRKGKTTIEMQRLSKLITKYSFISTLCYLLKNIFYAVSCMTVFLFVYNLLKFNELALTYFFVKLRSEFIRNAQVIFIWMQRAWG